MTHQQNLLSLLLDGKWHSWRELSHIAGTRYNARLHELRCLGYSIVGRASTVELNGKDYQLTCAEPQLNRNKLVKVYLNLSDAQKLLQGVINNKALKAVQNAVDSYQRNL